MSLRYLAGFITASYNPLKVPNAPTIGTATAGSAQATITFTAPSNVGGGAITSYIAVATKTSDGTAVSATGSASPITITGLTNGSAYTIQVAAVNTYGPGPYSAPSGSVTPYAPKLFSWGMNLTGGLGQGNAVNQSSPVQVGALNTWLNVACGKYHVLATKTDGALWTWGSNDSGQLGQNDTVSRSSPVQVGALTNWLKGSINSGNFSMAIKTDGTLWAWGTNYGGALGLGNQVNRSSPVQIGALTTWLNVAGGEYFTIATKTDGTLWSWGDNAFGQLGQNDVIKRSSPVQVGVLSNWLDISASKFKSFAIKTDGTLWAWGEGTYGALGTNNTISRSSPVQVGALTNWSKVSSRLNFSLAVKTDGTLWSWGNNANGQLGQNIASSVNVSSPVQVGALTTWLDVSAGNYHGLAISTNGSLWSWGLNSFGQLGLNIGYAKRSSPVQIGALTSWLSITTGILSSFAISS